jgi:quercetin dioxygenase-like cupin family protein
VLFYTAGTSERDPEKTKKERAMNNVLENIPFQDEKMGSRKLVDEKYLQLMQAALKPGQTVPQHNANSNVHILVVRGEVVINLDGTDVLAKEGSLVPVIHQTLMNIKNKSGRDASFLIIKTPNPSEMAG